MQVNIKSIIHHAKDILSIDYNPLSLFRNPADLYIVDAKGRILGFKSLGLSFSRSERTRTVIFGCMGPLHIPILDYGVATEAYIVSSNRKLFYKMPIDTGITNGIRLYNRLLTTGSELVLTDIKIEAPQLYEYIPEQAIEKGERIRERHRKVSLQRDEENRWPSKQDAMSEPPW